MLREPEGKKQCKRWRGTKDNAKRAAAAMALEELLRPAKNAEEEVVAKATERSVFETVRSDAHELDNMERMRQVHRFGDLGSIITK